MATIKASFGEGGSGVAPEGTGAPSLATVLRDQATDLAVLRAAFVALTAKIDADSGDTGGDSDYAATVDPVAMLTIKG